MRVLVAMSGGVDSSVAAALMLREGHEVVGATMKLWGGYSDSGCCSVADVEDARRVAQQLGIVHHVFNFTSDFERDVVDPYVAGHARATTPNPCIACNQHLKFGRFLERARLLGFDAIATGHHARVTAAGQRWQLRRGRDLAKDQSYVLYMLGQEELACLRLPIGELTKAEVRSVASDLGLRTAEKPDSQDVCFISKGPGREGFLAGRIPVREGRLVTTSGDDLGKVDALELVTVGQRRGLGLLPRTRPERRYVLDVDLTRRTATVGTLSDLLVRQVEVADLCWSQTPPRSGVTVEVQLSAHGVPLTARWEGGQPAGTPGAGPASSGVVVFDEPTRRVAPGQAVVLYEPMGPDGLTGAGEPTDRGDVVIGGGTAL
ncbi:MAG TPA: tRNA 2-thiouridine(34) synthase MnmA [Acidimicrobiales bacterium]|nr:tRNA 2-thiouridine(34) synthase MnmA [Acidimicrobiales bacterium]